MEATIKKCAGCNAALYLSDPDVCETCDLHGNDDADQPTLARWQDSEGWPFR